MGCREKTLHRDEESSTPKRWIRENTKISPVLEVTTNYHHGKPGIEIRIASQSGDKSHSWVRISNGLIKLVRDLTEKTRIFGDDEVDPASTGRPVAQETRIVKYSQTEADKPAAKAKAKPTSCPISSPSPTSIPIHERNRIDIEPNGRRLGYRQAVLLFASRCTFLDMVNVGYITVDLAGSQCKACALVRFELRGVRC